MTNTPGTASDAVSHAASDAAGAETLPRTEVLIVGGGISALVAAAELAGRGRSVTILERRPRPELGGQARDAFGGIFFVGSPEQRRAGIRDSIELAWADWQGYAEFGPRDHRRY